MVYDMDKLNEFIVTMEQRLFVINLEHTDLRHKLNKIANELSWTNKEMAKELRAIGDYIIKIDTEIPTRPYKSNMLNDILNDKS